MTGESVAGSVREEMAHGRTRGLECQCEPRSPFAPAERNGRCYVLALLAGLLAVLLPSAGCNSELLEKQAEQIKQQETEIAQQRQEIEKLTAAQQLQEQKQQNCNRAFRDYFEKAQALADKEKAVALYQQGLKLCPDDDVAHYELGKILAAGGRNADARAEFEAALKINPGFVEAKSRLEALGKDR